MENSVLTVNGTQLGERDSVDEGFVESRTFGTPKGSDGNDEVFVESRTLETPKGSEGNDEVFVDAAAGDTPRSFVDAAAGDTPKISVDAAAGDTPRSFVDAGYTPRSDQEDRVVSNDGNAEKIETLNDGNEIEDAFEESGGATQVEGKELGSAREGGTSTDQDVEKKQDEDNGIVEDEEKQSTDVPGEAENSKDGDEISDLGQEPKKLENGVLERLDHDAGANVVTAQLRDEGHEPLGSQNANEVKGGNQGSNNCNGNDSRQDEVNEADGVISDGHQDGKLKELVNVSSSLNGDHLDSPGEEPVDFPTGSDVKPNETDSPSMPAENEDNEIEYEAAQADGVITDGHQDGKLKELVNVSSSLNGGPVDSPGEEPVDFPTGSAVKPNETYSPSMPAENEDNEIEYDAAQADIASSTDYCGTTPGHEINVPPPLVGRSEAAGSEKLLHLEDCVEKFDAGSIGLTAESSERSEPLQQETSIDESLVVEKEMDSKDKAGKVNQATPRSIIGFSPETSSDSKADLVDANAEISGPVEKELHAVTCRLYSEPESKDDQFMDANQSGQQNTDQNVSVDASSTTVVSEISASPVGPSPSTLETREQESAPGNTQEQVTPAIGALPSSNRPATTTPAPARPAGLGRAAPLLEPASRPVQQPRVNGTVSSSQNQLVEEPTNGEAEETDETREKLQMIRVKFLRLAHRLGQTPHNVVVAQVLYRLGLAEQLRGRSGSRVAGFSFDRASSMAEQLEASGQELLDFSCTIMVLGKTGVGKSATINSIFDEVKFGTDAFQSGTKKVQDVVGTVQGIKVRVIDTPGLLPSWSDQRKNEKTLLSVKQFIKKTPPDIILYLDRLDMPSREFGDMPLLRTITEIFGPSIWFNAIVVLTHAASAPPEGPNGTTSYDMFVTQRSHVVQQAIRLAAGDMRLMNPVSLVENHSACRTNRAGQRVLPNGQVWKPHLLLLSFASKILAEANTLLKLQDSPPGKPFAPRSRAPSLPFLLSSLLQSRAPVKLPSELYAGDDDDLDDDLAESSDSEDESEYDELPPFKRLTKAQLAKLPRAQRKAYHDELEYRERLFMKQQLKEEKKRRKMMKKMQATFNDLAPEYRENVEEESSGASSVPVPMPDLSLPASFDSDNPTHRYRCLDSSNQWLVRPVLDPNSWDHDVGYEGINVERLFTFKEKIPISFSGQFSKDKKDTHLQMEMASTIKHGEGKGTSVGFDLQSMGRDIAYTLRSETRFSNWRKNKALAGLSVTLLGDTLTGGMKVEDKLIVNKRGQLVVSAGAVVGRGDVAYGGSLEATLRDKDHPLGRFLSTLGLSVMDWHGDLAIGCNLQSQIPVGRSSNLIGRVSVNNRGSGQVSIRFNSTEHLQIVLFGVVPLVQKLLSHFQPVQLGG